MQSERPSASRGVGTASSHSSPRIIRISGQVEPIPQILYVDDIDQLKSHALERRDLLARGPSLEETALEVKLLLTPRNLNSGEISNATLEITCRRLGAGIFEVLESTAPKEAAITPASRSVLDEEELVEPVCFRLDPSRTYRFTLSLGTKGEEESLSGLHLASNDTPGDITTKNNRASESRVVSLSPIMGFLARAFAEDYLQRRLSFEQSGWRGLMHIVNGLKVPKSHAYGEARYGHTFGRPLEILIKAGIVEYRIFRGKGRGGNVVKVRACYETESVKRLVDKLVDNR